MNQMQILYVKDFLYISWDNQLEPALHWWFDEHEIKVGRLTISYS